MNTQPLDASHAMLFLGKLSRDRMEYTKSRDQASLNWFTMKNLETAFFAKYPNHRASYDEYMISESKHWQKLFGPQFKLQAFAEYVFANREDFTFIY